MHNDWILDVLRDLTTFAHANGMPGLAEHLEDAQLLAAAEMGREAGDEEGPVGEGYAPRGANAAGTGDRL